MWGYCLFVLWALPDASYEIDDVTPTLSFYNNLPQKESKWFLFSVKTMKKQEQSNFQKQLLIATLTTISFLFIPIILSGKNINPKTIHTDITSKIEEDAIQVIGKWTDPDIPSYLNNFYLLYKKNGKIYLNYCDLITVQCTLHKIKDKEYILHDDQNGTFYLPAGTSTYIGWEFEECMDNNGNWYQSNVILIIRQNKLYVYSNDYDKRIYHLLCVAKPIKQN